MIKTNTKINSYDDTLTNYLHVCENLKKQPKADLIANVARGKYVFDISTLEYHGNPDGEFSTLCKWIESSCFDELTIQDLQTSATKKQKSMKKKMGDVISISLRKSLIHSRRSLKKLILVNIPMTYWKECAKAIGGLKQLAELTIDSCSLDDDGCQFLFEAMKRNMHLNRSFLCNNKITDASIPKCCSFLGHASERVTSIRFRDSLRSGISRQDGSERKQISGLLVLDLSGNQITDKGANILSQHLRKDNFLKFLGLRKNNLTPLGQKNFIDLLSVNDVLECVDITGQKFVAEESNIFEGISSERMSSLRHRIRFTTVSKRELAKLRKSRMPMKKASKIRRKKNVKIKRKKNQKGKRKRAIKHNKSKEIQSLRRESEQIKDNDKLEGILEDEKQNKIESLNKQNKELNETLKRQHQIIFLLQYKNKILEHILLKKPQSQEADETVKTTPDNHKRNDTEVRKKSDPSLNLMKSPAAASAKVVAEKADNKLNNNGQPSLVQTRGLDSTLRQRSVRSDWASCGDEISAFCSPQHQQELEQLNIEMRTGRFQ